MLFIGNSISVHRGFLSLEGAASWAWPLVCLQIFNYFPLSWSPAAFFYKLKFSMQKSKFRLEQGTLGGNYGKCFLSNFFCFHWLIVLTAKTLCLISSVNSFGFISSSWFLLCFFLWEVPLQTVYFLSLACLQNSSLFLSFKSGLSL